MSAGGTAPTVEVDAVVIGAGFGGIQSLYVLERLGLSLKLIEAGSDVGGVWNWNRYPGARTDIQSYQYCYSFSEELWEEWEWSERYPAQPEVLEYLRFAADRFDLRKYMQFDTTVESATFDESTDRWMVRTDDGALVSARFVVSATGGLSRPLDPPFEGVRDFQGDWYVTARWPHHEVDFTGKRVGVIGTGSTGVQVVPSIAGQAESVTVFQRTPNYVVEAGNAPLSAEEKSELGGRHAEIRETLRSHPGGLTLPMPTTSIKDHPPEVVQEMLEASWQKGGLNVVLTFWDVTVDMESNEVLCEFIRNKIRSIVDDPETAELLCPKGYPFGAKRPPIGHHYYEAFNRPNVRLVDVHDDPIRRITPTGLATGEREFEFDAIIYALGFDAITGSILSIDFRGRGGESLQEQWVSGPRTYLGCCAHGFPNLFFVAGPQTPFANQPVVIDVTVELATAAIRYALENDLAAIEPSAAAVEQWCTDVDALRAANKAVANAEDVNSFIIGANVEGKAVGSYFYFAPVTTFRERLEATARDGFAEFDVAPARLPAAGAR
jgi:cation diffusion facilitator CzcD-associated flavoprotein CzcO